MIEERNKDINRLIIISVLLATFFGVISYESILETYLDTDMDFGLKLLGAVLFAYSLMSLFVIPLTIMFILLLAWKYNNNFNYRFLDRITDKIYFLNILLYTYNLFIFLFLFVAIFLLEKEIIGEYWAGIILIIVAFVVVLHIFYLIFLFLKSKV